MNLDGQRTDRILVISFVVFIFLILSNTFCYGWHQTLTFVQQSSYEISSENFQQPVISHMKFFMWHNSYAIYGARDTLIILKLNLKLSTVSFLSYNWPVDQITMEECLQEWNTKDKCYNDIVHVRISSDQTKMSVYCTYAHRPLVRSFDLQSMSFINGYNLTRDPHPPMDSESSYVMLNFPTNIITAGYQGDYIPTIRAAQGKTLLYALRPNSYFIGGFQYDGKAVFGVVETSERSDTNRVSRLVMACSNRTEIIRKATLNCSTDMFDHSRSFTFHILTALVDPIRTSDHSSFLFATFTTNNASITASAVCLFILDKQFYDVFTAPSKQINPRTSIMNSEIRELVSNCNQSIPSTIDRDMVESGKQFLPYLANPLLIETLSKDTFTSINVIQYKTDLFCLIIGTSDGRLLTAFTNRTFQTKVFEELTLPLSMQYSIRSITYRPVDENSYVVVITNQRGYLVLKLSQCNEKLCLECWTKDCTIRRIPSEDTPVEHHCSSDDNTREMSINDTEEEEEGSITNHSLPFDWSLTDRVTDEPSGNRLLFYIVVPMSVVIFLLSMSIIILVTNRQRNLSQQTSSQLSSISSNATLHTFTNQVLYRTDNKKKNFFIGDKTQQSLFPTKSQLLIRPISDPVYSTSSSNSLPPLVLPSPSPAPTIISSATPRSLLSVQRLYKSYV